MTGVVADVCVSIFQLRFLNQVRPAPVHESFVALLGKKGEHSTMKAPIEPVPLPHVFRIRLLILVAYSIATDAQLYKATYCG